MTKLPPPRTIKTAILKMDSTIMNREGIEKILTMMPTENEKNKISEAQMTNPELPLGNAENFLFILSSITDLEARLKLWAFKLDYDLMEKEIGEHLMDLKKAIEEIEKSETFRYKDTFENNLTYNLTVILQYYILLTESYCPLFCLLVTF